MDKPKEPPKIRVVVRKRPLFGKEITRNEKDVLTVVGANSLAVQEVKEKVDLTKYIEEHHFTFDNVFEHTDDNQRLYEECVQPLVAETFKGAKTTCFAYGQTGSGKTFTMMGTSDGAVSGMYTLASYDIIELLEQYEGLELFISFYEIYCGKLFDLLNKRAKVECREDSRGRVQIANLTEKPVQRIEEVMDTIHAGLKCRTSGTTGANAESSRSHAILTYFIKHSGKVFSKMSFIDLAGSERGADVIDTGKKTKQDGAEINKSLLALKECIRALDQAGKAHLPFRQSKLTQVLKDSFMGNSKTTMIANVSPALSCCEPTLNTLRYADRVKELKKDPKLKALQEAGGDALSKELMLARQNNNTKIIKLDQKTGRPVSEMQELGKDFKLTKKAPGALDPAELLARKQAKQQEQQAAPQRAPAAEPSAPRQREAASPQKVGGIGRGIGSGIGGGTKPRPGAASATAQRPGGIGQGRPQQNNFVGGDDGYDDEDEIERVEDFAEENERYQTKQLPQTQPRKSRPQQPRLDEVQAAEDRLAALELHLDSAENNLLIDDEDPFGAEVAEPRGRPQQHRRRQQDDYGAEDPEDDLLAEQHQRTLDGRGRGRPSRRDELVDDDGGQNYSQTLKNLGDGLANLQDKRDRARHGGRHQTQDIQLENVDDELNAREAQYLNSQSRRNAQYRDRARQRDDSEGSEPENVQADHAEGPGDPGHRRNISGNPTSGNQSAGFRSKLRAPTSGGQIGGGLKQPTQSSSSSQAHAPGAGDKKTIVQGLKSQVSSFKERLQSSKTNRGGERPNARDAMKKGDKKVLFGSMVETTSGGDDGGHLLGKQDRNPRSALKQPNAKLRGMSQAPALGGKKLSEQPDYKKPASKLLQSRQDRYANQAAVDKRGAPKRERLGDGVPTFNDVSVKYANNIEQLGEDHERIIEQILEEEEQLIFKHNTSCKQSIKIVEEEMAILKNVDKPGSDVESYVEQLDKILVRKIEMMVDLRRNVLDFYKNIKTEEQLAKLYQQMQESQEYNEYDDDYMNQYGRPNM